MKKTTFILLGMFLLTSLLPIYGQKVKCEGTYSYTYSENISHAEAKAKAVENAIIMALADEFGTTVTSQAYSEITNTSDRFAQISRLQVKGKLLRHIRAPKISAPVYGDNLFTVNVTVSFYAQAIEYAPVEFEAKILCNGTEEQFEADSFKSEDKFYMLFRSPKEGYVAIFFEDRETAVCMLPYVSEDEEPFRVEKGQRYTLFTVANNTYHMSCGTEPEINYVHVIFSPNKFIDGDLERVMSCSQFRKWLGNRQNFDDKMQVQSSIIKISPASN
ncbi:MAG: hypothetical protein IJZ86_05605 [Bacteroides sp.]|nr:hypothetical protein [Bacteroides sp.]